MDAGGSDWPPMPDALALAHLPADLLGELEARAGAGVVETMFNGPFFAIPLDREDDLIGVLRSAGFGVCRNDALIVSIDADS